MYNYIYLYICTYTRLFLHSEIIIVDISTCSPGEAPADLRRNKGRRRHVKWHAGGVGQKVAIQEEAAYPLGI